MALVLQERCVYAFATLPWSCSSDVVTRSSVTGDIRLVMCLYALLRYIVGIRIVSATECDIRLLVQTFIIWRPRKRGRSPLALIHIFAMLL